jgi:hypothetical protein
VSAIAATKVDQSPQRLREAGEHGRLAGNPALYDVLVGQAQLERRIRALEELLATAQVSPTPDGAAEIGTCGRVRDTVGGPTREQRERPDGGILRFAIGAREVDSAGGIVRFGLGRPSPAA